MNFFIIQDENLKCIFFYRCLYIKRSQYRVFVNVKIDFLWRNFWYFDYYWFYLSEFLFYLCLKLVFINLELKEIL